MINYEEAREIATKAHEGVRRETEDAPYVVHPIRVAESLTDENAKIAAVLHDVIEDDTGWTEEDLRQAGVPEVALEAVVLVSRRKNADGKNEIYMAEFIERIATAPGEAGRIARQVKLADIADNLRGIDQLPPEKRDIEKRYLRARKRLERAVAELDS